MHGRKRRDTGRKIKILGKGSRGKQVSSRGEREGLQHGPHYDQFTTTDVPRQRHHTRLNDVPPGSRVVSPGLGHHTTKI